MIDFDAPGLNSGYISLHNSTNVSAWQSLRLPIYCINGAQGPTTLVLSGIHGDEYEGPIAIQHLLQSVKPEELTGRLILLPAVNLPAVLQGVRLSPDDGLNLNRVFPGNAHGSLTERIAHVITQDLIPLADHVIDLHSGGRSLNFAPSVLLHEVEGAAMDKALNAAIAFGAPFTILLREDHADVMIDAVVERAGKVMLATELGGAGVVTPSTANTAKNGLRNCLARLGHYAESEPSGAITRLVSFPSNEAHVLSEATMIYEPVAQLGQRVEIGEVLGLAHTFDRTNIPPVAIHSPQNGWFVCTAGQGLVHRGDVVAIVAPEVQADHYEFPPRSL